MATNGSDAATGLELAREGRFDDALPYLERANRAAPSDVSVLNAVGNLLVLAGRGDDADARYRIASRLLPADLRLLCGWARVSLLRKQPAQATELFRRALAVDHRCGKPGGWLESIVLEVADNDVACDLMAALVAAHPQHAGLRAVQAKMLVNGEYLAEAQAAFEAYRTMCPHDAWVRVELGGLASGRGDADTARAHFRDVLRLDPGNPDAIWGLGELEGGRLDNGLLTAARRALDAKPSIHVQARLHHALAKHYDRVGEYPAAWRYIARTNALAMEATPPAQRYDAAAHEARVSLLIEQCDASWLERLRGAGSDDRRPVFVIGLPRSGTTLLERMFAAHPCVVGVGEQKFAGDAWKRALATAGGSHHGLTGTHIADAAAWHAQRLDDRVRHLGLPTDAERIVDKMPDNYLIAGWLALTFPAGRIVHIQRDPRDVAISCWFSQFTGHAGWINELRHIAHRIEQHRRMLRHWRAMLGERLLEVRYEDIVADPARELRRLLAAMDLQWHPDVVAFAQQQGYVATASRMQVREPVHARSLARWRNYEVALEPILARLDAVAVQDALEFAPPVRTAVTVDQRP